MDSNHLENKKKLKNYFTPNFHLQLLNINLSASKSSNNGLLL